MKFNRLNCFAVNNKHFLFDGNTGNYFQLPHQNATIVKKMISDKDNSIFTTIQRLYLEHKLTLPISDKQITKNQKTKTLAINISSTCNLRCTYCWNDQGSYGQTKKSKIISVDDIESIINFLKSNAKDLDINKFELFGGEPLLEKNIVKELVLQLRYFCPNSFIQITTNGTLIDEELADFFTIQGNIYLAISIDGNESFHNCNRPYSDGSGSYKNSIRGLSLIRKRNISYSVRATLPLGVFAYKEYAESFLKEGVYNFTIAKCYSNTPNYFDITDYHAYAVTYQEYLTPLLDFFRKSNILLPDIFKVLSDTLCDKISTTTNRCGAGRNILGIDTDGYIYPCEILAGDKRTKLGNIRTSTIKDIQDSTIYHQIKNVKFAECASCWLSGKYMVCFKCNLDTNEDLSKVPISLCNVKKIEMESAIWLTSLLDKQERETIINMITKMGVTTDD